MDLNAIVFKLGIARGQKTRSFRHRILRREGTRCSETEVGVCIGLHSRIAVTDGVCFVLTLAQLGRFDGQLADGQVGGRRVVRPLRHIEGHGVGTGGGGGGGSSRVKTFAGFLRVLHSDFAHAGLAVLSLESGLVHRNRLAGVGLFGRRGDVEVLRLRLSLVDGVLHAGGGSLIALAHGDAGGVLARVDGCGGQRLAILHVGDVAHGGQAGNTADRVKLCCRFFGAAVIGQRIRSGRGNREGPAELIGQIAALCRTIRSDGRTLGAVCPAMLMPGHGERLTVALIAVARFNLDFIRKGLACGQSGNGELLAVGTGIFLSQVLRNRRIRKPTPRIIDGSAPDIGQACTLIGCDRHCQRHRGAVLCVEGTAGVVRFVVWIDLCAFDGRWRDSCIAYAGSAILPFAVACFIAISIRQIFIRRNIRSTPFNLVICAAAQAGAAAIVFYGQTHV